MGLGINIYINIFFKKIYVYIINLINIQMYLIFMNRGFEESVWTYVSNFYRFKQILNFLVFLFFSF